MQREVAIILKVKNAAEVRKELKDVFNRGTTAAVGSYNKAITKTDTKQKKVAKSANKAGRGVKSFGNVLMGSVASLYAYNRAFTTTMNLMDKGASLERVGEVFKKTVGSLEVALPALRKATRGAIADFNLMKTANRAVIEGIQPEKLGSFFKMASMASEKLAINRADAIGMVTKAITRQDVASLKSLGIISKTDKALNVQMGILSKIGKIAAPAMRIQAMHDFVIKGLTSRYGQFNALFMDNMLLLERSKTAWTNLKASVGSALIQAFKPLLLVIPRAVNSIRDFLNTVSSNDSLGAFTNHLLSFGAALGSIAAAMSSLKLFKLMGMFFGFNSVIKLGIATIVGYAFGIKDIGAALGTAFTMGKVFFALLQSYNNKSGLSKIAKKDADSLGSLYGIVLQGARIFKVLQAAGQGAMNGILQGLTILSPILGSFGATLRSVFQSLRDGKPIAQSTLDSTRRMFAAIFNVVTKIALPLGALILGMKTLGFVSGITIGALNVGSAITGMALFTANIVTATARMIALGVASAAAWAAANPIAALGMAAVGGAGIAGYAAMNTASNAQQPTGQNTSSLQEGLSGAAPQNLIPNGADETQMANLKVLKQIEKHLADKNLSDANKEAKYSFDVAANSIPGMLVTAGGGKL